MEEVTAVGNGKARHQEIRIMHKSIEVVTCINRFSPAQLRFQLSILIAKAVAALGDNGCNA